MTKDWLDMTGILATALSALGTLGAVVVALRLASRSELQREREAMVRASLVSAGLVVKLEGTLDHLSDMARSMSMDVESNDPTRPSLSGQVRALSQFLKRHQFEQTLPSTMEHLAPLPGQCAQRIARAYSLIARVRDMHEEWGDVDEAVGQNAELAEVFREAHLKLFEPFSEAYKLLTDALRICIEAAGVASRPSFHPMIAGERLTPKDFDELVAVPISLASRQSPAQPAA